MSSLPSLHTSPVGTPSPAARARRLPITREPYRGAAWWSDDEDDAHQRTLHELDEELEREMHATPQPARPKWRACTAPAPGPRPAPSHGAEGDRSAPCEALAPRATERLSSQEGCMSAWGPVPLLSHRSEPDDPVLALRHCVTAMDPATSWWQASKGILQHMLDVVRSDRRPPVDPAEYDSFSLMAADLAAELSMVKPYAGSGAESGGLQAREGVPSKRRSSLPGVLAAAGAHPYAALVFDCGSGESKVLRYELKGDVMVFEERAKFDKAQDYFDRPLEFATLVKRHFDENQVDLALVAASAWMRSATGKQAEQGAVLLQQVASKGVLVRVLDDTYEAWLETVAVEYASQKLGLQLDGHWASGGGSTHVSRNFREVHSLPLGSEVGLRRIKEAGAVAWRQDVVAYLETFAKDRLNRKLSGRILGMSAVYYAALAVGVITGDTQHAPVVCVVRDFVEKIKRKCKELEDAANPSDKDLKTLSNLILQNCVADHLIDERAEIYLARDLMVQGQKFRVTWSCGWFLEMLSKSKKVEFDSQALVTMDKIEKQIEEVVQGMRQNPQDPLAWLKEHAEASENAITLAVNSADAQPWASTHSKALVMDCGTAESKILLYEFDRETKAVRMKELDKLGPAPEYFDNPERFVGAIQTNFQMEKADVAMVAASSWMRTADSDTAESGAALLHQCMEKGMILKVLDSSYEGWLEVAAVEYASGKLGLELNGHWASGGGSTQVSKEFQQVQSLPLGNRAGFELLTKKINEEEAAGLRTGLDEWRRMVRDKLRSSLPHESSLTLSKNVLAMSAVYYAAIAAGLPQGTFIPVEEVRRAFQTAIEERVKKWPLEKKDVQALSNLTVQLEVAKYLLADDVQVYFARDLEVDGKPFRITWSCGWFLQLLSTHQQIEFPGACRPHSRALRQLQKEMKEYAELARVELADESHEVDTGKTLLTLDSVVKMLLRNACKLEPKITEYLQLFVASQAENTSGATVRLAGIEHRLKTRQSLRRKLERHLRKLIHSNRHNPYFTPTHEDILPLVSDVLRYTVVIDREHYTAVYESFRNQLVKSFGIAPEYIRSHSFWHKESHYYGITCDVTIPNRHDIRGSLKKLLPGEFTFELVFHTEESYHHNVTTFTVLKRVLESMPDGEAKVHLYRFVKKSWESVELPMPDPPGLESRPFQDLLLEQIDHVLAYQAHFLAVASGKSSDTTFRVAEDLCGRIIRGKDDHKDFEHLGFPRDKKLVWVAGPRLLQTGLEIARADPDDVPRRIADAIGYSAEEVRKLMAEGFTFKLVVFPKVFCKKADWKGLIRMSLIVYPLVASVLARHSKHLEEHSFAKLEAELQAAVGSQHTFQSLRDKGCDDGNHITLHRLSTLGQSASPWHARAFLYNAVGANELYKGDGWTYDQQGNAKMQEYLSQNELISGMAGAVKLDLNGRTSDAPTPPLSPLSRDVTDTGGLRALSSFSAH